MIPIHGMQLNYNLIRISVLFKIGAKNVPKLLKKRMMRDTICLKNEAVGRRSLIA